MPDENRATPKSWGGGARWRFWGVILRACDFGVCSKIVVAGAAQLSQAPQNRGDFRWFSGGDFWVPPQNRVAATVIGSCEEIERLRFWGAPALRSGTPKS